MQNLTGRQFGKWKVLKLSYTAEDCKSFWLCECVDCGVQKTMRTDYVKRGKHGACAVKPSRVRQVKRPASSVSFEVVARSADLFYRNLGVSDRAEVRSMLASLRPSGDAKHNGIEHRANQQCVSCQREAVAVVVMDRLNAR